MEKIIKSGKIAILFIAAVFVVSLVSYCVFLVYYISLTPDSGYFAGAYTFAETDLRSEPVIINLSESDFSQYPVLRQLLNDPESGGITFNRFEWDYERIQDFRNRYCVNRSVNRYVWWNNTCYQIVVGQS